MSDLINQYLKFRTDIFLDCYKMWNSPKYALVQKGSFFSALAKNDRLSTADLFQILKPFKFDVDVIQKLGAAQNENRKMLYDEGFLNMLQRLEIEKSIKFTLPDAHSKGEPIFEAKGAILYLMIIEKIILAFWKDTKLVISE